MRVLLKISGEALKGEKDFWVDIAAVERVAFLLKDVVSDGHEIAVVIGWGNIYRGSELIASWVNPADSHNLSMLSTVFNGVILKNILEKHGIASVVLDPLHIDFLEPYNKDTAKKYLESTRVVICTSGTGNPYFTTDSGGVLRAIELWCDMMVKATKVDGVYSDDPVTHPEAEFFETLSYDECITKKLKIMDQTALVLAKENALPLKVIRLFKDGALQNVFSGKKEWTVIKS